MSDVCVFARGMCVCVAHARIDVSSRCKEEARVFLGLPLNVDTEAVARSRIAQHTRWGMGLGEDWRNKHGFKQPDQV